MNILIVSATQIEIQPLLNLLGSGTELLSNLKRYYTSNHRIDILVTGVGMVATSCYTTKAITLENYDIAVNMGICGSFRSELAPGEVVNVKTDYFPELGVETDEGFLSLTDLKLESQNKFPFQDGKLVNTDSQFTFLVNKLTAVNAVTVNTAHGEKDGIEKFIQRTDADIETMEGAAFFYACFQEKVPCLQLRAVSNYVEPRDTSKWNINLAVQNLNQVLADLLEKL